MTPHALLAPARLAGQPVLRGQTDERLVDLVRAGNEQAFEAIVARYRRPLLRYFPELRPLGELLPPHSALDGEIVIARDGVLDFDSMQLRLHPAESRVRKLSAEIPAEFVVFDLLLWEGKPVHEQPIEKRRKELERVATTPVPEVVLDTAARQRVLHIVAVLDDPFEVVHADSVALGQSMWSS